MFDEIRYMLQGAKADLDSVIDNAMEARAGVEDALNSIPTGNDELRWIGLSEGDWHIVIDCIISSNQALDNSIWSTLELSQKNKASADFVLKDIQAQLAGG
jgi:hypothetical protein